MERLAGGIMMMSGWRRALLAFCAGLFGVLALQPIGFFAAMFVSFSLLVWLLDGATGQAHHGYLRRQFPAFRVGWWFGFGYFLGGLWWLGNALLVEAEQFAWALPLAVLGLPAALGLFYGFATMLARMLWSDSWGRIAALAIAFAVMEWLRSFVFTGFPWNAIGQTAMPVPLMMQSVAPLGIYSITLLSVFVYAAPALIGTRRGAGIGLVLASVMLAAHVGYGAFILYQVPQAKADQTGKIVRLVQPVIAQTMKMDDAAARTIFEEHLSLTAAPPKPGDRRPDMIVWPETSVPFLLTDNPEGLARIADVLQDGQILLAGAVRAEPAQGGGEARYYNSIYAIDDQGQIIAAADKVHLVPFGEYMPFASLLASWGVDPVAMPGGFSAALEHTLLPLPGGATFYPLICYEAIFPYEIDPQITQATALLNVTNDAWYGDSPGPYQHFHQAQIRAVETGVPLIRAANSGISVVVDAQGRVSAGLDFNVKGFIDTPLPEKPKQIQSIATQNAIFAVMAAFMLVVALFTRRGFIFMKN
ncbi:apolipoprotein N-acyltransferase [Rhizobium sp. CFBP 8762]|uniref:apolipoprotein N-acyltransferase n=1 Tax=Rhizobium sp. CFBP 8762 TaxID=2775279 RepID=UPI0017864EB3|nr:apolipoprotein N-acyltransferase [Rhizobium sp. CFBP 8762]MBD8553673.1 apolipoprotein N-acyltransferase [Rhizobium sp. CFBP 8762]